MPVVYQGPNLAELQDEKPKIQGGASQPQIHTDEPSRLAVLLHSNYLPRVSKISGSTRRRPQWMEPNVETERHK